MNKFMVYDEWKTLFPVVFFEEQARGTGSHGTRGFCLIAVVLIKNFNVTAFKQMKTDLFSSDVRVEELMQLLAESKLSQGMTQRWQTRNA